ncbi:MAG: hypothetical protein PUG90_01800 [Clostridia bacterium]|nr:hypothetical protein [Clostridia bacterium]MDY4082843.1 hypothetical protein [Eubacteriales bacterium]
MNDKQDMIQAQIKKLLDSNNDDPIVLTDSEGKMQAYDQVAVITVHGSIYAILEPVEVWEEQEEYYQPKVLEIVSQKGKDTLREVDEDTAEYVLVEYDMMMEEQEEF